jgi:hypothetical protein
MIADKRRKQGPTGIVGSNPEERADSLFHVEVSVPTVKSVETFRLV